MMMKKRMAACIALAALMVCLFVAPAFAEQTERNLMLGTSGLDDYDSVYLGSHSGEGFGCMMNQPCNSGTAVKWHIFPLEVFAEQIEDKTKPVLFSQCVFGGWSEGASYVWPMPSVGDANAFVQMLPEKMFSDAERSAVPSLSSPSPFYNYNDCVPKQYSGIGKQYWSNSEEYDDYRRGKYFDEYGTMYTEDEKNYSSYAGARPWGALNDESVLFISKAPGGKNLGNAKTGFVSNAAQEIDTWRFTLKDQTRSDFAVTSAKLNENQATVNYTGAQIGTNEYISAIITEDGGNILYYGRFKQLANAADASGEVTITCPYGTAFGKDKRLYVFNEQYNGDENDMQTVSDYASDLWLVNLVVSFDTQGNGSAPAEQIVGYGLYAEKPAKPEAQGKVFSGWFKDADCTQAWDFDNDAVTEDITLYANWDDLIAFSSATANGSDTESTTELTLTFDKNIANLTADDITLTGADKGELTKVLDTTGKYILSISNITAADKGTVTVKVEKSGWEFTPDSQTVTVRRYIPFAEVTDAPTTRTPIYDGSQQDLVEAGSCSGGTMQYALGTDDTTAPDTGWSSDIPTGINAQTYYVWYRVLGDGNHNSTTPQVIMVSIAKATPQLGSIGYTGPLYANTPGSAVTLTRTDTTVPGTLKLTVDTLTAGENQCEWQFAPTDKVNYNIVTGTVLLNVLADELRSIQASGTLQKSVYSYGETFSPAGLTITAHYDSSVTEDVTSLVSYNTALAVDQASVVLSYGGKTCEVAITVNKAQIAPLNGLLNIANDKKNNYFYDLSQLLAALDGSKTYGNVSYQLGTINLGSHYSSGASISGSTLKLPINAVRGAGTDVGTINVKITSDNYAFTADAVITVKEGAQIPEIEDQPASASYLQGDQNAKLKVKAKITDGGKLTYQWYCNTANSNVGGTPVVGADGANYKPSTDAVGTMYYYCVVTNTKATGEDEAIAVTETATVTILPAVVTHKAYITVIGFGDTTYTNVHAKLMPLGSTATLHDRELSVVTGTSPERYLYHETLTDGQYNLVVTAETGGKEVMVTVLIDVVGCDDTHAAYLPEVGKSSIVDDNSGMGIIAGNVDAVAANYAVTNEDGSLAVTLTTELGYDPETASHDGPRIIQQAIQDHKTIEMELDIELTLHQYDSAGNEKDKTDLGGINGQRLEILIPVNTTGRVPEGFAVYRVHKGELQKLPYGAGDEYFTVDIGGKYVKLCVKRFSSYAIGYGEPVPQSLPTPPQTGDNANLALWIALMSAGLAGIIGLFLSRKRKES